MVYGMETKETQNSNSENIKKKAENSVWGIKESLKEQAG